MYLGTYIICNNSTVTVAVAHGGCVNPGCPLFHRFVSAKFCAECGKPVGEFTVPETKRQVYTWDIDTRERLTVIECADEIDIWLPNLYEPETSVDFGELFKTGRMALDKPGELADRHTNNLLTGFSQEVELLKEFYGAENVSIKWGLIFHDT